MMLTNKLSSSWSQNIVTVDNGPFIPIMEEKYKEKPVLQLYPVYEKNEDYNAGLSSFFAVAIPLTRTWSVVDLHEKFDKLVLTFNIFISEPSHCKLDVTLLSLLRGEEHESNIIGLDYSIERNNEWQTVNVPMIAFRIKNKDFCMYCVRLFRLVCHGYSQIKFSDLRIEESSLL